MCVPARVGGRVVQRQVLVSWGKLLLLWDYTFKVRVAFRCNANQADLVIRPATAMK